MDELLAEGLRRGYWRYAQAVDPTQVQTPDCPYPLRSPERDRWLDGWSVGRRLAERHRAELRAVLAGEEV